jgi:hypothetical protein
MLQKRSLQLVPVSGVVTVVSPAAPAIVAGCQPVQQDDDALLEDLINKFKWRIAQLERQLAETRSRDRELQPKNKYRRIATFSSRGRTF